MEAETTQTGKIKNPVTPVDAMQLIWKAEKPRRLNFIPRSLLFKTITMKIIIRQNLKH
jgi:hypothetical protein